MIIERFRKSDNYISLIIPAKFILFSDNFFDKKIVTPFFKDLDSLLKELIDMTCILLENNNSPIQNIILDFDSDNPINIKECIDKVDNDKFLQFIKSIKPI